MDTKVLTVGVNVKWSSQAQGSIKTKQGTVYAVVEPQRDAKSLVPKDATDTQIKFDNRYSDQRRFIIAVPRGGKSNKVDYYCPRVTALQLAE